MGALDGRRACGQGPRPVPRPPLFSSYSCAFTSWIRPWGGGKAAQLFSLTSGCDFPPASPKLPPQECSRWPFGEPTSSNPLVRGREPMRSWAGQVHCSPTTRDAVNGSPAWPSAPPGFRGLAKQRAEPGCPARPWGLRWSLCSDPGDMTLSVDTDQVPDRMLMERMWP